MGNAFGGTISRNMAESCVETLQKDGLKVFASEKWSINSWHSSNVFGSEYARNQSYRAMVKLLTPEIQKGFKAAACKLGNVTGNMEDFIEKNLAHHIMKELLAMGGSTTIDYQELHLDSIGVFYELPAYDKETIRVFQQKWLQISPEITLSLDTTDEGEKDLLSAALAQKVEKVVAKIDVASFITNAIREFQRIQAAKAAVKIGLFAGVGAKHLLAGRQPYSDEDQEADTDSAFRK